VCHDVLFFQVLMTDPIVAADGVTYQRSAFKKYIGRCHACKNLVPLYLPYSQIPRLK
jgi:hypothetical protein